jgi:hypothetical protein
LKISQAFVDVFEILLKESYVAQSFGLCISAKNAGVHEALEHFHVFNALSKTTNNVIETLYSYDVLMHLEERGCRREPFSSDTRSLVMNMRSSEHGMDKW